MKIYVITHPTTNLLWLTVRPDVKEIIKESAEEYTQDIIIQEWDTDEQPSVWITREIE